MKPGCLKKLAIVALALALVGGCAQFKAIVGGVQDILCNPTAEQQTQAEAAMTFISIGVSFAGPVVGLEMTAEEAKTTLYFVKSGICVALAELQAALAYYDAMSAQVMAKAKIMKGPGLAPPMPPDVSALKAWVKR